MKENVIDNCDFFTFSTVVRSSHSSDSPRLLKMLAVPLLPYCLTQRTAARLSTFQQYAIMQYMQMQFTVNKSFILQLYILSKQFTVDNEFRFLTTIGLKIRTASQSRRNNIAIDKSRFFLWHIVQYILQQAKCLYSISVFHLLNLPFLQLLNYRIAHLLQRNQ